MRSVVADHTKWGTVGISTIASLQEADVLVTDSGIDAEALGVLTDRVSDVRLADVDALLPDEHGTVAG